MIFSSDMIQPSYCCDNPETRGKTESTESVGYNIRLSSSKGHTAELYSYCSPLVYMNKEGEW